MAGEQIGADDYALRQFGGASGRYSWLSAVTQRFGQISALSQFLPSSAPEVRDDHLERVLGVDVGRGDLRERADLTRDTEAAEWVASTQPAPVSTRLAVEL